tara:strand:- start:29673 stop:30128 length:456 start_codon:yes stop_codon:yes gene_type:complete
MYYLGDPCYIIPDDEWDKFCEETLKHRGSDGNHLDSIIDWHGQEITIWSNGGDGTWTWDYGVYTANSQMSFGVDAGIFCVIDLDKLPKTDQDPATCGMTFHDRPRLEVKDGVVYINDKPDNSVEECENCNEFTTDSWYDDDSDEMRCNNCW